MLTNSHQIKILSATTNINRSKSWCTKGNTAIEPHLECRHKAEHAVAAPTSEEAVIVVAVDVDARHVTMAKRAGVHQPV
jgi:hypothetical protein